MSLCLGGRFRSRSSQGQTDMRAGLGSLAAFTIHGGALSHICQKRETFLGKASLTAARLQA